MTGRVDGSSAEATQLGFDGMPQAAAAGGAVAARLLPGLPAPLPVQLPRPAGAAEGSALGAQLVRRGGAHGAGQLVEGAGAAAHGPARAGRAARRRLAVRRLSATRRSGSSRRVRARDMVHGVRRRARPRDEPVGVERTVALKTDHAALFGRVDRIDDRAERGPGDRRLQDRTPAAHRRRRPHVAGAGDVRRRRQRAPCAVQCRRVELHHLPTGEVLAWDHSDEGLDAAHPARRLDRGRDRRARRAVPCRRLGGRGRRDVPGHGVEPMCGWCDFNRVCSAGSAAARLGTPGPASKSPNARRLRPDRVRRRCCSRAVSEPEMRCRARRVRLSP